MPKAYYQGGSDRHLVHMDRNILFQRADDAPLPYAEVSAEELAALVAHPSGCYVAEEGASEVAQVPAPTPTPAAAPPARRGRKSVEG